MQVETKIHVHIDGDQTISKPSSKAEVSSMTEAVLKAVENGADRFSTYEIDSVTMPDGQVMQGQPKNHSGRCYVGHHIPLMRDDLISQFAQKLADAQLKQPTAQGVELYIVNRDIKALEDSIDYLKTQLPNTFIPHSGATVNRPFEPGTKFFDRDGTLLLTVPDPNTPVAATVTLAATGP